MQHILEMFKSLSINLCLRPFSIAMESSIGTVCNFSDLLLVCKYKEKLFSTFATFEAIFAGH